MEIVIGKGVGPWRFDMTKGNVIDLMEEDANFKAATSKFPPVITTKTKEFYFDKTTEKLRCITVKKKGAYFENGIQVGSSLDQVINQFGVKAVFVESGEIELPDIPGVCFELGPTVTEMLYQTGMLQDVEFD